MTTTAETLRKAKAHISDPKMWHKGDQFLGDELDSFENLIPSVVPCCAFSAACVVTNSSYSDIIKTDICKLLDKSIPSNLEFTSLVEYNDHPDTTHDDIMALFDRAIELVEGE